MNFIFTCLYCRGIDLKHPGIKSMIRNSSRWALIPGGYPHVTARIRLMGIYEAYMNMITTHLELSSYISKVRKGPLLSETVGRCAGIPDEDIITMLDTPTLSMKYSQW